MKTFTTLLLGLFTTLIFSQNNIAMSSELEPYIESFVQEGIKRGYKNIRYDIMSKIDTILLVSKFPTGVPKDALGAADNISKNIYISNKTLTDTLIVRSTVYHEISHLLKNSGKHSCNSCSDIMSATSPKSFAIYFDNTFWQKELDKLFNWIYKS